MQLWSPGPRLRTLCNNRHSIRLRCYDPHHAQAARCKHLVINLNFLDKRYLEFKPLDWLACVTGEGRWKVDTLFGAVARQPRAV